MKHFNPNRNSALVNGFAIALLLSIVLTGCESVTEIPIIMSVSTGSLQFTPSGGDQSFEIISNTNHWTISSDASSWLSITPTSGQNDGTIQVSAASNTSISQKSAVITITGKGIDMRTITVTQEGVTPFVSASESAISLTASAGEKSFTISSNTDWSITRNGANWFTFSPTSSSGNSVIKLTTTANTTPWERTARATLSGTGAQSQDINVTQAAGTPSRIDESWRSLLKTAMTSNPTHTYTNDRYKGQTNSNGNRHGLGAYYWNSGDLYIGAWINNDFNGFAIYLIGDMDTYHIINCPETKIYAGNFANDVLSGTGSCYNINGVRLYNGNFTDGKPNGTYPGTTANGANRFDVIKSGNNYYIGETYNGKRSGYGIFLWQNGNIWYGQWSNDTGNGSGIYLYQNGIVTAGTWKE